MKKISIFFLLAFGTSAYSDVIWQPAANCKTKQFSVWYTCSGESVPEIKTNQVTESSVGSLGIIPIENAVTYDFQCSASRQFNVGFTTGLKDFPIFWNATGTFRNTYSYNSQTKTSYKLIFNPLSTSTGFKDGCALSITSNISIPNIEVLTSIVDSQKAILQDLADLEADLSEAAELPAKWAALKASKQTVGDSASSIDFEREELENELKDLKTAIESELSQNEKDRIAIIPTIIQSYTSISSDLQGVKGDIDEALKISEECESNTPESYCITKVDSVINGIKSKRSNKETDLKDIATFLTSESTRLKDFSQRLSKKLSDLALTIIVR